MTKSTKEVRQLCDSCERVLRLHLAKLPEPSTTKQYISHHLTFESFRKAVQQGCRICVRIANNINFDPTHHKRSFPTLVHQNLMKLRQASRARRAESHAERLQEPFDMPVQTALRKMEGSGRFSFAECTIGKMVKWTGPSVCFRNQNTDDYPIKETWIDLLDMRDIDEDRYLLTHCPELGFTGHGLLLSSTVSHWYKLCVESHTVCNALEGARYFPTRLIEVPRTFDENVIRLIDSVSIPEKEKQDYMTLSHCWGLRPLLRYTNETEISLRDGVCLKKLPKTFRDAVQVVQHLQCRYLWIDSLCIKQDDPKDWERESKLMENVYGMAACNIGASASKDSAGGLFYNRKADSIKPCIFENVGAEEVQTKYLLLERHEWELELSMEPLQSRGWTLQEAQLARCMVYFTKTQIKWHCRELVASETYPIGLPFDLYGTQDSDSVGRFGNYNDWTDRVRKDKDHAYYHWELLAADYARRLITKSDDKLIAVSGLARRLGSIMVDDEYMAGIWKGNLPYGLLWSCERVSDVLSGRPSRYRAPSWSWASLDTPINFETCFENEEEPRLAILIDAEVTLRSEEDLYGPVTGGMLVMLAMLWPMKLSKLHGGKKAVSTESSFVITSLQGAMLDDWEKLDVAFDAEPADDMAGATLFLMPLVCVPPKNQIKGLVLLPVEPGADMFTRVGYYEENDPDSAGFTSWEQSDSQRRQIVCLV